MKKILFVSILSLGLISCSSCIKKNQVVEPAPVCSDSSCPVLPRGQIFTGDTWEITVPDSWTKSNTDPSEAELVVINSQSHNLLILTKEAVTISMEEYSTIAIESLQKIGAQLTSVRQVNLHGVNFVLLESHKNNTQAWIWVTVKDGLGYSLSCGGHTDDTQSHDVCFGIASSLKIK